MSDQLGGSLPRILIAPPGPKSLEAGRRLAEVESRNITYLTPQFPVFWEAAKGANVQDVDGNIYLDLTGAFGVSAAGHGPEGVTALIRLCRRGRQGGACWSGWKRPSIGPYRRAATVTVDSRIG